MKAVVTGGSSGEDKCKAIIGQGSRENMVRRKFN